MLEVTFTQRPLYPRYPLYRSIVEPQSGVKRKHSVLVGSPTLIPTSSRSYPVNNLKLSRRASENTRSFLYRTGSRELTARGGPVAWRLDVGLTTEVVIL